VRVSCTCGPVTSAGMPACPAASALLRAPLPACLPACLTASCMLNTLCQPCMTICLCAAADLGNLAQASSEDAAAARAASGRWAISTLTTLGLIVPVTIVLHALVVLTWRCLPSTRRRPLPAFLSTPVLELLVGNALVLPLALSSAVLLCQGGSYGRQALGGVCLAALLLWLSLVTGVAVTIHKRQQQLGLGYVDLRSGQSDAAAVAAWLPAAAQELLQRLSPPWSGGFWDIAGLQQQEHLRRGYQGKCEAGCTFWTPMPLAGTHGSLCRATASQTVPNSQPPGWTACRPARRHCGNHNWAVQPAKLCPGPSATVAGQRCAPQGEYEGRA
jgi:hypothetical protein